MSDYRGKPLPILGHGNQAVCAAYKPKLIPDKERKLQQHHFKISIQTLYIALKKYDMITQKKSSDFWAKANVNHWLKSEPNPLESTSFLEKNSRLVSNLKELYISEQVSSNKVSEVMGFDMMETRKMLKEWSNADEQYEKFA